MCTLLELKSWKLSCDDLLRCKPQSQKFFDRFKKTQSQTGSCCPLFSFIGRINWQINYTFFPTLPSSLMAILVSFLPYYCGKDCNRVWTFSSLSFKICNLKCHGNLWIPIVFLQSSCCYYFQYMTKTHLEKETERSAQKERKLWQIIVNFSHLHRHIDPSNDCFFWPLCPQS